MKNRRYGIYLRQDGTNKGKVCILSEDIETVARITNGAKGYGGTVWCDEIPTREQIHEMVNSCESGLQFEIVDSELTKANAFASACELYKGKSIEQLEKGGF